MGNFGIVQPSVCPYCGYQMDDATGIQDRETPIEEDLSICFKCTGVMVFDSELALQPIPQALWDSLPPETIATINKGIAAINAAPVALED